MERMQMPPKKRLMHLGGKKPPNLMDGVNPLQPPSAQRLQLIKNLQICIDRLNEELHTICMAQKFTCKLYAWNAIGTLEAGFAQFKDFLLGKKEIEDAPEKMLHGDFVSCVEPMVKSEDDRKKIRELLKLDVQLMSFSKRKGDEHQEPVRKRRKDFSKELCERFKSCVKELGGKDAYVEMIQERMVDDGLTEDDVEDLVAMVLLGR